jgi:hypothetical protein
VALGGVRPVVSPGEGKLRHDMDSELQSRWAARGSTLTFPLPFPSSSGPTWLSLGPTPMHLLAGQRLDRSC